MAHSSQPPTLALFPHPIYLYPSSDPAAAPQQRYHLRARRSARACAFSIFLRVASSMAGSLSLLR